MKKEPLTTNEAPLHDCRAAWISDLHLGTPYSCADQMVQFLREYTFETLYIVGDLVDLWQLKRGSYWSQAHNDVIQKILRLGRKGTQIIYIPGNHDDIGAGFFGQYGNIAIQKRAIHTTAAGRRLLVMHGHELDAVMQHIKWLAYLGDIGYQILLHLNAPLNAIRRCFGLRDWSLSAYAKQKVKGAVSYIGDFENSVVRYAKEYEVDGVICGHIHSPAIREIDGVAYYNSGDWVESRSALVEHWSGEIELLTNLYPQQQHARTVAKSANHEPENAPVESR